MLTSARTRLILLAVTALVTISAVTYTVFITRTDDSRGTTGQGFKTINSQQLADMLAQKDFKLINVHTPYEGEISQTDANIPYPTISTVLDRLPADKSTNIIVYCKTGQMSRIAAQKLVSLGYRNIYDLSGGMEAWQAAGNQIIHKVRES